MATKRLGPTGPTLGVRAPIATAVRAPGVKKTGPPLEKRTTEELVIEAQQLKKQIDRSFYQLGLTLAELKRPERYQEQGFRTFEELLAARDLGSWGTAHKLFTIVQAFDERTALALGSEKAYEIVRYAALAYPNRTVREVLDLDPVVAHDPNRARLSKISGRALTAAAKALRAARRNDPLEPPERFERASRQIAQLLRHAGIDAERVQSRHRRGKKSIIRIDLTLEEAEDLVALMKERRKTLKKRAQKRR